VPHQHKPRRANFILNFQCIFRLRTTAESPYQGSALPTELHQQNIY